MTLSELETALKAVCPQTWHLAAPAGATRGIVWHEYAPQLVPGDNSVQAVLPKVQLDVLWQDLSDTLPDDVMDALAELQLAFDVQDHGYDDEYAAMRCILQMVVA